MQNASGINMSRCQRIELKLRGNRREGKKCGNSRGTAIYEKKGCAMISDSIRPSSLVSPSFLENFKCDLFLCYLP
jgi:hypothetical protein